VIQTLLGRLFVTGPADALARLKQAAEDQGRVIRLQRN
jgi:hypothetical protein